MTIPTIDEIVLASLDFFIQKPPPSLDISKFIFPFVIGSGNGYNTGQVLFSGRAAIFADESNFRNTVVTYGPVIKKGLIKDAVVISASGEKDSVWEIKLAKENNLKTTLLTCKPESSAARIADRVVTYKSIAEPYTYNTSTYLGMILSATGEDPKEIKNLINGLDIPENFDRYVSYAFILPDKYLAVAPMVIIKDNELFGPHIMIRAHTEGHARHAKFVHRWEKELVVSVGTQNRFYGNPAHRWEIAFSGGFGAMIALTYYLCGLIQKGKPGFFEDSIAGYCRDYGPKAYGKSSPFEVIVPANN